ncbi:MAG: matrixin family metalloprotease [Candidatus Eisenbacteria bacterium]|uniref:Matrixin family metalloprotease n=1 Tax=Eiseniibacteriota bacterium TaxID=2212470 RepID=A0A849SP80_UNCEI|nr:matrixin family metalloprotease [Candidatus Eisenbacteria bacterium]
MRLWFCLVALLVILLPARSHAFRYFTPPVGWAPDHGPVTYKVNPASYPGVGWDPTLNLVHSAFRAWESAMWGRVRLTYGGSTTASGFDQDNQSTVSFNDADNILGCLTYARTQYRHSTSATFQVESETFYKLIEADLMFNNDEFVCFDWDSPEAVDGPACPATRNMDLQTVAMHEVGHFIGLGHSSDASATMYGSAETCDRSQSTLDSDDIAGGRTIYAPPGNAALRKSYTVTTNGADDARQFSDGDLTDGSLVYTGSASDACAGWQNNTYSQLMEIRIRIDLGELCRVTKIRYNMGNVQRAESWNADLMISPFGQSPTAHGTPNQGAWTEQTGSLVTSPVYS